MKYKRKFKDNFKRKLYKRTELFQRLFKIFSISFDCNLLKFIIFNHVQNQDKDCFQSRIKNYCIISCRSRGVHSKFKVSRIVLKELSGKGCFYGLKKASW